MLENLLETGEPILVRTQSSRSGLIVTTPTVARLYLDKFVSLMRAAGCEFPVLVLECNEKAKTIDQVATICERSLEFKLDRKGLIVGFGGGVCTDLVTVAASLIRRGVGHVRVPTTLIGQIDAAIGIKGGLNFSGQKSYLGCFYPPRLVVIDPHFLSSVPAVHLRSGLAEILKIAIVRDVRLFRIVESYSNILVDSGFSTPRPEAREVLWLSVLRMVEELEQNIYEDRGYDRLVDFGHTFSPLLESASQFRMTHGEAVALDMALSCMISWELGLGETRELTRILSAIHEARLPIFSPLLTQSLCENALDHAIFHRGGMLNLVVPALVGDARFVRRREEVDSALLHRAILALRNIALDMSENASERFETIPNTRSRYKQLRDEPWAD